MSWQLRFLGVGSAQAPELGSACAVLEHDGQPELMIDCGAEALSAYQARYAELPRAVYLTHTHFDHVAGMERWFFGTFFDPERSGQVRLYCHAALVPWIQARVADYPGVLAEGGVNYWDGVRLIPCQRGFWHGRRWYDVFPTRHHEPDTSFGIALAGSFVFTGDTRPVPEQLQRFAGEGVLLAHDCALQGNPSHTGVDDIEREYPECWRGDFVLYHYGSEADGAALSARGFRVAQAGDAFDLNPPGDPA
jgi:ribonuclease BN (tRNA processing enzyme)